MSLIRFTCLTQKFGTDLLQFRVLCSLPYTWLKQDRNAFYSTACLQEGIKCKLKEQPLSSISTTSSLPITNAKTILNPQNHILITTRTVTFFNKITAEALWKGVTSVSNVGAKRGRGKGGRKIYAKDLNRGQVIGKGEVNMLFPGLNAPIIKGRDIVKQQPLPTDEDRAAKIIEIRSRMGGFRPLRLHPLERGFSGTKLAGRSIGPPDPIGKETFEGFDTKVLESKRVSHSTPKGKKGVFSVFVVVGNKNGLAGFALAKSATMNRAMKRSKNKAGQTLNYYELYEGRTVFHDFHTQFLNTGIYVKMKPKGYGLNCHRVIREICHLIGIKDLHAKVEGSTNVQNMTKAFFMGLLKQRTHQQLADEKGLYVAKLRPGLYPQISAAPANRPPRSREDISLDEETDLKLYVMGGRVELEEKEYVPFYTRLPSYEQHLKKQVKCRNHDKIRKQLLLEYGEIRSFLSADHPECVPGFKIEEDADD